MNTDDANRIAENRLFERMKQVLEAFLADEAPLYSLVQVGVHNDYMRDEIVIKLHIKQGGSAHEVAGPLLQRKDRP